MMGVKLLCTQLEKASMKGCNFEDPAGSRSNMEGEESLQLFTCRSAER